MNTDNGTYGVKGGGHTRQDKVEERYSVPFRRPKMMGNARGEEGMNTDQMNIRNVVKLATVNSLGPASGHWRMLITTPERHCLDNRKLLARPIPKRQETRLQIH